MGLDRVDRVNMVTQPLAPHRIPLDTMFSGSGGVTRHGQVLYRLLNGHAAGDNPGDGAADWGAGENVEDTLTVVVSNDTVTSLLDFDVPLLMEYVDGGLVSIRVNARVKEAGAPTYGIKNLGAYVDKITSGALGGNLVGSPTQALNNSATNHDFVVTPTGLVAGDLLRVRLETDLQETTGEGGINGQIYKVYLLCNRKI